MNEDRKDTSQKSAKGISRRAILQATAAIGVGTTLSIEASTAETTAGELLWSSEIGWRVLSSPTVADGTVFVGNKNNNVYALDADTGEQQWVYETGDDIRDSSPTVVDGTVYIGSYDSHVHAIDADSGDEVWTFETGIHINSSPTVVDGIVFVGSRDRSVYAIDAEAGEQLWQFQTDDEIRESSPTVVDGTVYIGSRDSYLYAIDAASGEQLWRFETNKYPTSPTVKDGTVYVGTNITSNREEDGKVYALDAESGNEYWSFAGNSSFSSPTVVDGTVFIGNADDSLYALDSDSGTKIWTYEAAHAIYSTPTVVNDTVFISHRGTGATSNDVKGGVYALDAASGIQAWWWHGTDHYMMESSPAVADGILYVGSYDGSIYAIDAGVTGSQGSRLRLGTLGHNDDWAYADQEIDMSPETVVSLSVPETVEPDESFRIEATVENTGVVADETGATLSVDGDPVDSVDSIAAGESVTLGATVTAGDDGTVYTISVDSQHDSQSSEIQVSSSDDSQGGTDTQGQNNDEEQDQDENESTGNPTAAFTYTPSSPTPGEQVAFNATESTSPNGEIVSYTWKLEDGQTESGDTVNHTYSASGGYNVELTITDEQDKSDTVTQTITITEEESSSEADDSGPGFGIGTTLAGLGGIVYVLKRRLSAEEMES